MKIRVGVIGPNDSIEIVKNAAEEFEKIEIYPYPYVKVEETNQIILQNREHVDQWIFSGQAPYYYAFSNGLISEDEGSYPPLNGNSLYKTLLEAQIKEQKIFKRISLDTIQEHEIEAIHDSISPLEILPFPYTGYMPAQDIIDYHVNLYRKGEVDIAITCIQTVYASLNNLAIPCYRVIPDIPSIRLILQILKERGESFWYRKAQIAILGIEMFQSSSEEQFYSYKMKHQELELKRILLTYAELINGSFVQIGDEDFFIYTTRGELELQLKDHSLINLIKESHLHSRLNIRIGIGYGITALEAEQNARKAIQYARNQENPAVVLVDEDKKVTENVSMEQQLSYYVRQQGSDWEEKLKDAHISPTVISRIQSLSYHYKKNHITSQELAQWLKSTERNARRILSELERLKLVRICGEEQSGQKGRPRKIYELKLHS
ncbi:hypothetical protein CVD25_14390 [Bacillus canaveralius]|uniref:Transcriptional regulator n=1 Tax=Bacillus canaveralius TaxID=1403243 RepID=A0A2N5GLK9_9BACI|nr:hypothetical protein [Bacillus canaveralius]PLR82527.1 hypothetical protein CU635_12055 [Bacillus canaveralius]PLR95698.1 hypothetical protein CVD25_14390 [Bacillus canaveralius]